MKKYIIWILFILFILIFIIYNISLANNVKLYFENEQNGSNEHEILNEDEYSVDIYAETTQKVIGGFQFQLLYPENIELIDVISWDIGQVNINKYNGKIVGYKDENSQSTVGKIRLCTLIFNVIEESKDGSYDVKIDFNNDYSKVKDVNGDEIYLQNNQDNGDVGNESNPGGNPEIGGNESNPGGNPGIGENRNNSEGNPGIGENESNPGGNPGIGENGNNSEENPEIGENKNNTEGNTGVGENENAQAGNIQGSQNIGGENSEGIKDSNSINKNNGSNKNINNEIQKNNSINLIEGDEVYRDEKGKNVIPKTGEGSSVIIINGILISITIMLGVILIRYKVNGI